jgi:glutamate synthase domain-containing protein 3
VLPKLMRDQPGSAQAHVGADEREAAGGADGESSGPIEARYAIATTDRAVLARLSGELAQRAHAERMKSLRLHPRNLDAPDRRCYLPEPGTVRLEFEGSAGQGFACFLVRGVEVRLIGEANDSVAKGMSGGSVTIVPAHAARFCAEDNVLIGNGALYGATGGSLYLRGRAGDRFAVRNSGAEAVLEGAGLHACEYMTGGRVAILGPTGRNVAAGMSGGVAYLLDLDEVKVNGEMVDLEPLAEGDIETLREMLTEHRTETGSPVAEALLADDAWPARFTKVMPRDYKRVLAAMEQAREAGTDVDEAVMAAVTSGKG